MSVYQGYDLRHVHSSDSGGRRRGFIVDPDNGVVLRTPPALYSLGGRCHIGEVQIRI